MSIGGKNIRVEIDNALLKRLEKTLKKKLEFDELGNLKTNFESKEESYRAKQAILKNLLAEIDSYDIDTNLQDRAKYLKSFLNSKKSTVYNSDLTELEHILGDATEMYDKIKGNKIPKKSPEKKERELKEKVAAASTQEEKIEAVKEVIAEFQESELGDYLDDDTLNKTIDSVVVTTSSDEYIELASENLDVEDNKDEQRANSSEKETQKIVLPPNASVEDITLEVIEKASKGTEIESAIKEIKEQKSTFKGDIVAGLNNLTSNIKTQGLNYRNINYFGDNFIKECERLCRESGQSLETMFSDYFSASSSTRANSVLNRFILSFITRNGNDSSLRSLIEATLVKKAISNHLISSRFNNYLSEEYRNISVSGSGYINFESKVTTEEEIREEVLETNTTTSVSTNNEISSNINISENVSINTETNINGNINNEVSIDSKNNISGSISNEASFNNESHLNGNVSSETNLSNSPNISGTSNSSFNLNNNLNNNITSKQQFNGLGSPTQNMPRNKFGLNQNLVNNSNNFNNNESNNSLPLTGIGRQNETSIGNNTNPFKAGLGNSDNNINAGMPGTPNLMGESTNNMQNNLYGAPSMAMAGVKAGSKNGLGLAPKKDKSGLNLAKNSGKGKAKKNAEATGTHNPKGLRRNGGLNPNAVSDDFDGIDNESLPENNEGNPRVDDYNEPNSTDNLNNHNPNGNNENVNNNNDDNQNEKNNALKNQIKKQISKKILELIKKHPYVLAAIGIILLVLLLILIVVSYQNQKQIQMGLGGYPHIQLSNVCEEIHVYDTPYGEDGTYSLEEYIEGVVAKEIIGFNNDTLYEIFAIAARTYALNRLQNSSDCSIPGNTTAQAFKKNTNERITEAVNKTRGLVLTQNNKLISTMYDAFCWDTKDDNYYNICQKNHDTGEVLQIPVSWAEENIPKLSGKAFLTNPRYQSHGQGMSQDGAYYLVTQKDYSRDEIFTFFYGSETKLMSIYASSYTGEFPLNPNDELYQNLEFIINKPLKSILEEKGTSVEEFDNYLANIVETSGVGTREAVVNVAVSLIGSLANMGYKLNYQWGGKYYASGINASWGEQRSTGMCDSYGRLYNINKCLTHYKWASFDCSGFVNWALLNGFGLSGFQELKGRGIYAKTQTHSADRVNLNSNKAVCQAGDVLIKPGAHIVLIVGTDDSKNSYVVAESTGSNIVTKTGGVKLSYYSYAASGYFCGDMSSIYKNNNQVEEE